MIYVYTYMYNVHVHTSSQAEFDSSSLWEDEEQRSFYEDITDIRPFVPAVSTGTRSFIHVNITL